MNTENESPGPQTCGKGLAANSQLPAKLAEITAGLAEVLANHLTAIHQSEAAGNQEYDAYESLVGQFRDISAKLAKTADEMMGYRDLPMAEHDMSVMTSARSLEVFENFVRIKREVLEMMTEGVEQDEQMLEQMRR